jgi:hypothetical protein
MTRAVRRIVKLFISYAKAQRRVAEELNAFLSASGHQVTFDRDSFPPGIEYQQAIRQAVESCEVFVFLVSPESVAPRRYTLTELGYRQNKVKRTSGNLLPVVVKPTLLAHIPAYLRTVTLFFARGNLPADVADAVDRMALQRSPAQPETVAYGAAPSETLQVERIAAYRRLWSHTRTLPKWPRADKVSYDDLDKLGTSLRDWYFDDGGGLFLSRASHTAYASVQNTLQAVLGQRASGPIAAEHYDEVREVCSALRSQLAMDIGARGG